MRRFLLILVLLLPLPAMAADGTLRFAALGDFQLDSGATILDCRIGYRTYGTLAADR